MTDTLVIITGPTGSGKSEHALRLCQELGCDLISADSRQMFRDIPIGTAAPTAAELSTARHHFVGNLALDDYYSAARYEEDVMAMLPEMFGRQRGVAVMCGGSMMYVDAVINGLDSLPTITAEVRDHAMELYQDGGTAAVIDRLRSLDPAYLATADLNNHRRLVHAYEICLQAGQPYSSLRTGRSKQRPFRVVMYYLNRSRAELFDRINRRTLQMVDAGLLDEAHRVYPLRQLNSLNTVGYKELFAHFDGVWDLDTAIARIQKNTRVYAKKQLLWLSKHPEAKPFELTDVKKMLHL